MSRDDTHSDATPSSTTRWADVKRVLDEALERPEGEQRTRYLDEACTDDTALRREVTSLLDAYDREDGHLDDMAIHLPTDDAQPDEEEERHVGPYRLLEVLDRGGMGLVYLAERDDDQFERQVAVKIVRRELDLEEDFTRRFLAERQILASLQHPHIAQLYDGGVAEDGRPYLVMEYVDGQPIHRYCAQHELPLEERLRLFLKVDEAVQFAHNNLVVHRDLKPSNILVTPDGEVKLLDFGIAKLVDDSERPDAPLTRPGQRIMTPEYASPEQVRGNAITTASDVYQLGVLLYELLAGERPFAQPDRSIRDTEAAILDDEPVSPSRAAKRNEDTDAKRLPAGWQLRGDLDVIALKALRKEPERRYASAQALRDDVERHLKEQPVTARPATWRYRTRTFVRRNRWGVGVAATFLALLVTYAATVTVQARRIAHERDKAQETASFLVNLFEVADPSEVNAKTVTARELLDRGTSRIRTELESQSRTRALLLTKLGHIHRQLGFYDQAAPLLQEALTLRKETYGSEHGDVAASMRELGKLRYEQSDYAAAAPLLTKTLAMRKDLYGSRHAGVAESLRDLGWLRYSKGSYARAESLFTEALVMRRSLFDTPHPDIAESLNDLGAAKRVQGQYQQAEKQYRDALAMHRKALGDKHVRVAETMNNLAAVLQDQGRYDKAEPHVRPALELYRSLYGSRHPEVATTLSNLAYVLQNKNDYQQAEQRYREALAMRRDLLGEGHPHVAHSLNSLAAVLQDQGRYDKAEPLARKALSIYREKLGDDHKYVAQALNTLAWLLRNNGNLAEAEPMFRRVLDMRKQLYGPHHPEVATSTVYLASLLCRRGRLEDAEQRYREALADLNEGGMSDDHPLRGRALTGLGAVQLKRNRPIVAESLLRKALAIRKQAFSDKNWTTAHTRSLLGAALARQDRPDEAEPLLRAGHATLRQQRGPDDWHTRQAARRLAEFAPSESPTEIAARRQP